ncbi:hypothetical protein EDD85DRAFT_792766 [Armillaria nabsnona]|nr:hypothetical protein EDD85DRAFT_792766 [Armillaria nabsnona]
MRHDAQTPGNRARHSYPQKQTRREGKHDTRTRDQNTGTGTQSQHKHRNNDAREHKRKKAGTTMQGTQTQETRTGQGRKGLVKQGRREKEAHDEPEGPEGTAKDHELKDPENERSGGTTGAKRKRETSASIETHHLQEMASACSVSQAYETTKRTEVEPVNTRNDEYDLEVAEEMSNGKKDGGTGWWLGTGSSHGDGRVGRSVFEAGENG